MAILVSADEIDAGAQALRHRQQGGRQLVDWEKLPTATKLKWRDHAACVLTAAASARQLQSVNDRA